MSEKDPNKRGPGRPRLTVGAIPLPVYDSIAQCEGATGIPSTIIQAAKRAGCDAFRSNRVHLDGLLRWIFSQSPDANEDWGGRWKRAKALREEHQLELDKRSVIARDDATECAGKVMAILFAGLEKRADTLPAILHGADAQTIQRLLNESTERLKTELHEAFALLTKS